MKPRLALAGGGGMFRFPCTNDPDEHYTLIGLGQTGCSAISVLDAERESRCCAIRIDKDISAIRPRGMLKTTSRATRVENLSDCLSKELSDSWVTIVLTDLNDDIEPEDLETVACCCHQESELSIAIIIERTSENVPNDRNLEIFQKFDTCIHLSRQSLWDIGKKTKRLRLCGVKEFSLAHLSRCYLDVLQGKGVYAIDHVDLKNFFREKRLTVGVGVACGEERIMEALRQALSSLGDVGCYPSGLFACLAMSGSTLFEELVEVEATLESQGASDWLADVHSRDELNDDVLLTLFVTHE